MHTDGYAAAVDATFLERCLQRCQLTDRDHPQEIERCARETVQACSCACIVSEELICNALSSSISEAVIRGGWNG